MTEPNEPPKRVEDMETALRAPRPTAVNAPFVESRPHVRAAIPSFEAFYEQHYADVVKALSLTLGDAGWGREAADEAMTRAFDRWADIATYDNPAGWTYRVGLNWARSWHRKLARRLPWSEPEVSLPTASDPSLEEALASLDLKYRSVVVCRYLLDWSTDDTATALGIAPGTVKSRLSVGLDRLRSQLDEDNPSSSPDKDR